MTDLTAYQSAAYAKDYRSLVNQARSAEAPFGSTAFVEAVARYAYKLMAYKDEYEVARLYCDPDFRRSLAAQFENPDKISVFLAPPIFAEKDTQGMPKKRKFGPWIFQAFAVLKRMRGLRGTVFDIFGYSAERHTERQLAADYAALITRLSRELTSHNLAAAVALAVLPDEVRGFGHIKLTNLNKANAKRADLMAQFEAAIPLSTLATAKTQNTKDVIHV